MAANAFDALQLGAMFGAFLSVIILFIVPVTLLGTISPFAIRLAVNMENAGKISGKLYAVSTLGSFFGTFLPDLVLIPSIGTYKTFLLISSITASNRFNWSVRQRRNQISRTLHLDTDNNSCINNLGFFRFFKNYPWSDLRERIFI